jgi:hypothetical protein
MATILGEISEAENARGRGMLSGVVVNRETGMPGDGFFTLARHLGRDTSDELAFWQAEFQRVCDSAARRA